MMGGRIWVESEPGMGSEFHFTALLAGASDDAPRTTVPAPSKPEPIDFSGRRILLAEDNGLARMSTRFLLEQAGHRVSAAANGREALEALAHGDFDLVIMDIQMPEMDGLEATRRIRSGQSRCCDPSIPIIALTAHAVKGYRERFLDAGMDHYVAKPVEMDALLEAIEAVAGGGRRTLATDTPAESGDFELESLAVLDVKTLTTRYARELLQEMIALFLDDSAAKMDELRRGLSQSDLETVRDAAHSLVSTAGSLKALRVSRCARKLQEAAIENDWDQVRCCFETVQQELGKALALMQPLARELHA